MSDSLVGAPPFAVVLGYDDPTPAVARAESLLGGGWSSEDLAIVFNPGPLDRGEVVAPVEVRRLPRNEGYAGGMNVALSMARERGRPFAALLTHDCVLSPGDLRLLAGHLAAHPSVGVVGPTLRWSDRPGIFSSGGYLGRRGPYHRQDALAPGTVRSVEWVDGAILVVRVAAVQEIGGFDERLFMYVEDVDLGLRLHQRGWDVVVLADAMARKESSIPRRPEAYSYLRARNTTAVLTRLHRYGRLATFVGSLLVDTAPHLRRSPELRGVRDALAGRFGPPPDDLSIGAGAEG